MTLVIGLSMMVAMTLVMTMMGVDDYGDANDGGDDFGDTMMMMVMTFMIKMMVAMTITMNDGGDDPLVMMMPLWLW